MTERFCNYTQSGPVSAQQGALWFLSRLGPDDSSYNIACACRSAGELDSHALGDAMRRLAGRHDVLRSTFIDEAGVPKAIIRDELRPEVDFFDLRGQPAQAQDNAVHGYHQRPFDLLRGPCIRLGLFQCADHDYVWLLCIHHIIADFTTLALIMDELEALYITEIGGEADTAADGRQSFNEFIAQERRYLDGDGASAAKKYWTALLANPPPPLQWPEGQGSGERGGASVFFTLPSGLSHRLRQGSGDYGGSLFAVMLAAWAVFIGQRTRSTDMVIGVPVSRRDGDFSHTLGCFFNLLPLRLNIADTPFRALVTAARKAIGAALEHRHYPFGKIIEDLRIPRDAQRNPLVQTTVNMPGSAQTSRCGGLMLGADERPICWGNMELRPYPLRQQEGQVDLALEFADGEAGLSCVLKGQTALFSPPGLARAADDFVALLGRLIAAPDEDIAAARLPGNAESTSVFEAINPHGLLAAPDDGIVSRVDRWALAEGENVAVTDLSGTMTYRALRQASIAIARRLAGAGIGPGHRVGLGMVPCADALVAMLAIMRSGAAYVPLEPMNPPARIKKMALAAGVRVILIANNQYRAAFAGLPCDMLDIHDVPIASGTDGELQRDPLLVTGTDEGLDFATPDSLAYTLFTSGSTGDPKGINVLQRNVTAFLDAMGEEIDLPAGQKWTWFHAPSFDLSVWEIWGCLCSGGHLIVVPPELRSRPDALLTFILGANPQIVSQTPSGLRSLLPELGRRQTTLPARHLMISGEALPGRVARPFLTGGTQMWNLYGPSETTVFAMIEQVTADLTRHDTVPIGRPLRFATVAVLNERLRPVSMGETGEICIGGLGVGPGYVGLPELTAERFVPDPFTGGETRMYRTGDRGVWDGRRLFYLGRIDQQVKLNGYRIEIGEIESAIGGYPGVAEAAVLLEPAPDGERLTAVMALDTPLTGQTVEDMRRFLGARLPFYMVPGRFLSADSLPRNSHNKLDRKQLREQLAQGCFTPAAMGDGGGAEGGTPLLSVLKEIWCAVLGRREVEIDEVFFDIGGNSLTLLQVFSRLSAIPGCETLTPADLFRFPTIRSLAACRGPAPAADRDARQDRLCGEPAAFQVMAARRKRARDNDS